MNFYKYKKVNINPKTNISTVFDIGYYSTNGNNSIYIKTMPKCTGKTKILEKYKKYILCLSAYGVSVKTIKDILSKLSPEIYDINKGAFNSYVCRSCIYYSYHRAQLDKYIDDYVAVSEYILEQYESKDNASDAYNILQNNIKYSSDNLPDKRIILDLLDKILEITDICITNIPSNKELDIREEQIKQDLFMCKDATMAEEHYARLLCLWNDRNVAKAQKYKSDLYKAIEDLRNSGIVSAIYRYKKIHHTN